GGAGAINCGLGGEICSANFAQNATVTLVATPSTGGVFAGWTGACGGTATTCTVLMTQARDVTATFTGGTTGTGFALTVSVSGSGSVSGGGVSCGNGAVLCSVNETPNASIVLTATPTVGSTFLGWGGACAGTATTCTVIMTAARSVTATFSSAGGGGGGATLQLSVAVTGSGMVSGGGISCGNGNSTCRASLNSGSTCTLTLTGSSSVTATFSTAPPGTVTITVNGRGTISTRAGKCVGAGAAKTCVQHLTGKTATLTETPALGQAFSGWGGSCASAAKKPTCT